MTASRVRIAVLLAAIIVAIGTYYSHLSQYSTADEPNTLARIRASLEGTTALNSGSSVSFFLLARPGQALETVLSRGFAPNEKIFGSVHFTPPLPYALVQVAVCLVMLLGISVLVTLLARAGPRPDPSFLLLTYFSFLSFPLVKAEIKILKYDAISLLLSVLALLLYLRYRQIRDRRVYWCAIFLAGLAFFEKETTLSVLAMILLLEGLDVLISSGSFLRTLGRGVGVLAGTFAMYLAPILLLRPSIVFRPAEVTSFFGMIVETYFQLISPQLLFIVAVIGILIVMSRAVVGRLVQLVTVAARARERGLASAALFLVTVLMLASWTDQKNYIFGYNMLSPQEQQGIVDQGLFVSPMMASWSFTTYDGSVLLTMAKVFYTNVRSYFYVLPEGFLFLWLVPLFLLSRGGHRLFQAPAATMTASLLAVFNLLAHSALFALPEAKYNLAPYLLLFAGSLVLAGAAYCESGSRTRWLVVIGTLVVIPQFQGHPSYFGYQSALRSAAVENEDAYSMVKYPWVWTGWGETSYAGLRFLAEEKLGPARVAYDYILPFRIFDGFSTVDAKPICGAFPPSECIEKLRGENVAYLILSKNMLFRHSTFNTIVRQNRSRALFVDKAGDREFGWLFKVDELKAGN